MFLLDLYATQLLESQVNYELRILGINYYVFILIVGIILVIGGIAFHLYWQFRKREQNRKEVFQKVHCTIATTSGLIKGLYPTRKGQIKVTYKKKDFEAEEWTEINTKDGGAIDTYFCWADFAHPDMYPEGKPRSQQVPVTRYFFKEGDPIPKLRVGKEELTKAEELELTSRMTTMIQEESDLKIITGAIEKYIRQLIQLAEQHKWFKYVAIGLVVVAFLGLAGTIFGFINMSKIGSISSQLTAIQQYIQGQ